MLRIIVSLLLCLLVVSSCKSVIAADAVPANAENTTVAASLKAKGLLGIWIIPLQHIRARELEAMLTGFAHPNELWKISRDISTAGGFTPSLYLEGQSPQSQYTQLFPGSGYSPNPVPVPNPNSNTNPTPGLSSFLPPGIHSLYFDTVKNNLIVTADSEEAVENCMKLVKLLDQPVKYSQLTALIIEVDPTVLKPDHQMYTTINLKTLTKNKPERKMKILASTERVFANGEGGFLSFAGQTSPLLGVWFDQSSVHPDDSMTFQFRELFQRHDVNLPVRQDNQDAFFSGVVTRQRWCGELVTVRLKNYELFTIGPLPSPGEKSDSSTTPNVYLMLYPEVLGGQNKALHEKDMAQSLVQHPADIATVTETVALEYRSVREVYQGLYALGISEAYQSSMFPGIQQITVLTRTNAFRLQGKRQQVSQLAAFIHCIDQPRWQATVEGMFVEMTVASVKKMGCINQADGKWIIPPDLKGEKLRTRLAAMITRDHARVINAPKGILHNHTGREQFGLLDSTNSTGFHVDDATIQANDIVSLTVHPIYERPGDKGQRVFGTDDAVSLQHNEPTLLNIITSRDNTNDQVVLFILTVSIDKGEETSPIRFFFQLQPPLGALGSGDHG